MNQELIDLDNATKFLTPEFFEANPEIARKIFDHMLEVIGDSDPEMKAKIELQRAWFTVPGFRQSLGDFLWNNFTQQHPELQ